MEILAFLVGLGCLVLIIWVIALLSKLVADRKYRRQNRPQGQSLSVPPESKQQISSRLPPVGVVQLRQLVTLKSPRVSTRVRLPSSKHQQYIRLAAQVLQQLRSGEVQLPKAIAILRQMNPYAFEELLLTCCKNQSWEIKLKPS